MTRASGSAHTRVRVKICGVTNWADARLAVDLGADALGFNFYPPSPRSVSPLRAWEIIRRLPPLVGVVGVFVDWPPEGVSALGRGFGISAGRFSRGIARRHGQDGGLAPGVAGESLWARDSGGRHPAG